MLLRDLLKLCYHYDSNVNKITIIAITSEIKKIISNGSNGILLNSITSNIQEIYKDEQLLECEVSEFGIENDQTLFVKLC